MPNPGPSASPIALSQEQAATISDVLQALSDPLRVRIVWYLASTPDGRAQAADLASLAEVTQPTIAHHLRILRDAGIVRHAADGTARLQALAPDLARELPAFFTAVLALAAQPHPEEIGHDTIALGLEDTHRALDDVADKLAEAYPAIDREIAHRTVYESYTALARSSRIGTHLVALTEHFARQRLDDLTAIRATGRPPQVLFVCVQNAGRSQLAAAVMRKRAGDTVVVRSAGTTPAVAIHDQVRTVLAEIGTIPDAYPKPLTDDAVRAADIVITMGCGDTCPYYPGKRYEEWTVGDPALASVEGVRAIAADLDTRVQALLTELGIGSDGSVEPSPTMSS